ncbi:hypothetical protein LIA77_11859 [Sarocladium implicatum]|nr:hypothetical protein LIA77_11859 [Sarocladium implicatum]
MPKRALPCSCLPFVPESLLPPIACPLQKRGRSLSRSLIGLVAFSMSGPAPGLAEGATRPYFCSSLPPFSRLLSAHRSQAPAPRRHYARFLPQKSRIPMLGTKVSWTFAIMCLTCKVRFCLSHHSISAFKTHRRSHAETSPRARHRLTSNLQY